MHYYSNDSESVAKNWSHVKLIHRLLFRGQLKVVSEVTINRGAV